MGMITAGHSAEETEEQRGLSAFYLFFSSVSLPFGLWWGFSHNPEPATESQWALTSSWCFSCASSWAGTHGRFCSGMFWWIVQCKPPCLSWWPRRIEGGRPGQGLGHSLPVRPWSDDTENEHVIINSNKNDRRLTLMYVLKRDVLINRQLAAVNKHQQQGDRQPLTASNCTLHSCQLDQGPH